LKGPLARLYPHQVLAVSQLKTGSVLNGGVGSGKSLTAVAYYFQVECEEMDRPKDLYIITTALKRDTLDWEKECAKFALSKDRNASIGGVLVTVDSWNNITKYVGIKNAFFVFDEQRVVGSGSWVKSFLKITKENNWILLSATPGDTWMDYIPAFIANGFYKNRTEFIRSHVVYNSWTKYPKVDRYIEEGKLHRLRNSITVNMPYPKKAIRHFEDIAVSFDEEKINRVLKRWNPYENKPIKDISEYCSVMRKVVNSDSSRIDAIRELMVRYPRLIIFYNFNYELDLLGELKNSITLAEHNGHKHEPVPTTENWVYLVQYTSGSEGWNCVETNCTIFYSQNYSYRIMTQAAGRIDRLNTSYSDLYYYNFLSPTKIDLAISKSLRSKKDFNERSFIEF
jgi:hypothetical protein